MISLGARLSQLSSSEYQSLPDRQTDSSSPLQTDRKQGRSYLYAPYARLTFKSRG